MEKSIEPIEIGTEEYERRYPISQKNYVLVYDNGMQGYPDEKDFSRAVKQGFAFTRKAKYAIVDFGKDYYAGAVAGKGRIAGEVYELTPELMRYVDSRYVNGSLFERKLVKVNGFDKKCWIYLYREECSAWKPIDRFYTDKQGIVTYDWGLFKTSESVVDKARRIVPLAQLGMWSALVTSAAPASTTVRKFIPKVYNPNIKMKDGTMINKDKFVHDILQTVDALEKEIESGEKPDAISFLIEGIREQLTTLSSEHYVCGTRQQESA